MAKEKDMDKLFRDKLASHSVQPAPLAWDKLESRLSRKKKAAFGRMRVAAAFLLLGGLAALLWLSVENTRQELDILADQEPVQEIIPQETAPIQEIPKAADQREEESPQVKEPVVKKHPQKVVKPNLAVVQPAQSEPPIKERLPVQEMEPIELPLLDVDLLVAENTPASPEVTESKEVEYKVTIISNGLREKPEKENLVGEIENKIDKIGGLIGKVDQGFADLQDAKNNLFASITTKK